MQTNQETIQNTIADLKLLFFRNHHEYSIKSNSKFIVISGPNGAGKTNILEAISLLSPGRGLRNAKFEQILNCNQNLYKEWGIHCHYSLNNELIKVATGYNVTTGNQRIIKIDNQLIKKQSEILNLIKIIWLTPQMDGIFQEAPSIRRKFLDRMCYNLYPPHAQDIIKYEYYLQSRFKLLKNATYDEIWLNGIENNLAKYAIKITKTRINCVGILQDTILKSRIDFLKPNICIKGFIENELSSYEEHDLEEYIQNTYKKYRIIDIKSGRSNFGAHKSDLIVMHPIKNNNAQYCSTGEQKAMLLALILAQAHALYQKDGIPPILLLDEILAHFDYSNQCIIIEELHNLNSQVWITTTGTDIYNNKFKDVLNFELN